MNRLKLFIFSIIASFALFSFSTLPTASNTDYPVLSKNVTPKAVWVKDSHDFGEIPQGKPVTVLFEFTNNGDAPLIITDVRTSCGCTASDYPKEPIAAGKKSTIKVTYNAANPGVFNKTITVMSNENEATKVLTIKGTVK